MTNQQANDQAHNPTTFCPECEEGFQATDITEGNTQCPHCGADTIAAELTVTRIGSDGEQTHAGFCNTMAQARQEINDILAAEWGDTDMVLQDEPQPNGRWVDSADEEWTIT